MQVQSRIVSARFGITWRPVLGANENTREEARWNVRAGDHLGQGRQGFDYAGFRVSGCSCSSPGALCARSRGWGQNLRGRMERRLHDPGGKRQNRVEQFQTQTSNLGQKQCAKQLATMVRASSARCTAFLVKLKNLEPQPTTLNPAPYL